MSSVHLLRWLLRACWKPVNLLQFDNYFEWAGNYYGEGTLVRLFHCFSHAVELGSVEVGSFFWNLNLKSSFKWVIKR